MASIPPQRLTVDKIVKDLLEPATTSFYQVSISDPRQLNERGDTFATYLRQQGLEESTVKEWLQSVDWETLLNKRGTTWRKLDDPRKDNLDEKTAIELMLENPTLIKRPVLVNDSTIIVGFKEDVYQQLV